MKTRPVRLPAVGGGGQAEHDDPGRRGRRTRARAGPSTSWSANAARRSAGHLLAPGHQPGAAAAGDDLVAQRGQGRARLRGVAGSGAHGRQRTMAAVPARRTPAHAVALLVRHGRTPTTGSVLPGRAPGLHLSDEGRAQAEAAAERIAALTRPPVAVYASPLERAVETAKPIAAASGCGCGSSGACSSATSAPGPGQKLSDAAPATRVADRRCRCPSAFRFPGGESFAEMQARMVGHPRPAGERHGGASFVAVSHADPIKAAVADTAGVPLDLFQRLVVSPCSVTALVRGGEARTVLCVNAAVVPGRAGPVVTGAAGEPGPRPRRPRPVHRRGPGPGGPAGLPAAVPQRRHPPHLEGREAAGVGAGRVPRPACSPTSSDPTTLPDDADLDEPSEPHWVVGTLGVSYDEALDRIVRRRRGARRRGRGGRRGPVHHHSRPRPPPSPCGRPPWWRRAAHRARCAACPLDPSGHTCPRTNGHRPPAS